MSSKKPKSYVAKPPLEAMCWVMMPHPTATGLVSNVCCGHAHRPGRLTCTWHRLHEGSAQALLKGQK